MLTVLLAFLWSSLALPAAPARAASPQYAGAGSQPTAQPAGPRPAGQKPPTRPGRPKKAEPPGLFPLDLAWRQQLAAPPSVWPAYDEAAAYIPLKTGALVAVGLDDGVVRWTVEKVPVISPPAVDSGRLYLAGEGTIEAREAATGKPIWQAAAGGALTAPLVARAGWLIVALDNGDVRALRGETGEQVWQLALGAVVKTEPLIVGDRLYLAPLGSLLMSLDLLTGKTVWERDLGTMVNAIAAQGDRLVVGTIGRMFFGLDERRGEVKWRWRVGGDVIGRPGFDDERVYMISMANDMRAFSLKDGDQEWREPFPFRPLAGPTLIGGVLLVPSFSPVLRGFNPNDGKRAGVHSLPIHERAAPAAPPQYVKRPVFFDDLIVTVTLDGELIALRRRSAAPVGPVNPIPGTPVPAPTLPAPATTPTATAAAVPAPPA